MNEKARVIKAGSFRLLTADPVMIAVLRELAFVDRELKRVTGIDQRNMGLLEDKRG